MKVQVYVLSPFFIEKAQIALKKPLQFFQAILKYWVHSPNEKLKIVSFGDIERICSTIKEDTKVMDEFSLRSEVAGLVENWARRKNDEEKKIRENMNPSTYKM